MDLRVFLPKPVEKQFAIAAGSVKGSLDWFWIRIIILHVVGENHQLRDVYKTTEHFFRKASVDTGMFRNDPIPVVGLFDFNESQRKAVNEQCNVGPKLILPIPIGQFGDNMVCIFAFILQVNDAQTIDAIQKYFIERPP